MPSVSDLVREKLAKRAKKVGLVLSDGVISDLGCYFALLRKWNQKVSLTSLPLDELGDEAIDRLLVEPLVAAKYLTSLTATVMDVGSGGGSPAIPMKLVARGISLRMVESKTRKAAFLREAVRRLGLDQTLVDAARFEELLARPELGEAMDIVTMRAVRVERQTLMGLQAFLKPGGRLFLFRTGNFRTGNMAGESELATAPLAFEVTHSLLPHLDSRLAVFCKIPVVPRGTLETSQ